MAVIDNHATGRSECRPALVGDDVSDVVSSSSLFKVLCCKHAINTSIATRAARDALCKISPNLKTKQSDSIAPKTTASF